jgi:hypothetical protein
LPYEEKKDGKAKHKQQIRYSSPPQPALRGCISTRNFVWERTTNREHAVVAEAAPHIYGEEEQAGDNQASEEFPERSLSSHHRSLSSEERVVLLEIVTLIDSIEKQELCRG